MSLIKIVCANCGSQYRLPETFQADKAKCKKCGASIDVASQRQSPPAEPSPAPAQATTKAATSGASRTGRRAKAAEGAAAAEPSRSSRRSSGSSRRGRRGADDEDGGSKRDTKKKKNGALVWGSIGLLAVIIVVLIFVLQGNGDDGASKSDTAKAAGEAETKTDAAGAAAAEPAVAAEAPPANAAPGEAVKADAEPTDAAAVTKAKDKEKEKDPAPAKPSPRELKGPEDVFDPMKELQPVAWPEYVTDEDKAMVSQLIDDVEAGGTPGIKAKAALEKMGHKALAGVINKLREINYKDAWESQTAYELNKLLGTITMGRNVGFKAVDPAEDVSLENADWNAKTAKAWQGLLTMKDFATKEAFDSYIAERSKEKK